MQHERMGNFASAERLPRGLEIILNSLNTRKNNGPEPIEDTIADTKPDEHIATEIYSEYLTAETAKHNSKWLNRIRNSLFKKNKASAETFVYNQAVRDNLDFDSRKMLSEEQEWQKNLNLVKDEMRRFKEGDRTVRPLLLVLGGAMKGVHCAAQLQALEELGYRDSFAAIGGVSAGSGPAAFFAAGETHKAIKLFIEECTTKKFLDLGVKNILPTNWKRILNLDVIKDFMETPGEKGLDTDALLDSGTEIFTLATNTEGKVDIIDMKTATHQDKPDMVAACVGSAAIPLFRPTGHEVNGQTYFDGSVGDLPLDDIIAQYKATSILILANHSIYDQDSFEQTSIDKIVQTVGTALGREGSMGSARDIGDTLLMRDNKNVVEKIADCLAGKTQSRLSLSEYATEKQVKIGVHFCPPSDIGNLTNSPEAFAQAMSDSYRDTIKIFSHTEA